MDRSVIISQLPQQLYRAEQVRQLDKVAIEQAGVTGVTLMRRAGKATFSAIKRAYPALTKLIVFCGTGNNGGDGYVVATLARQQGIPIVVVQCGAVDKISGDALQVMQLAKHDDVEIVDFHHGMDSVDLTEGVIVDAILGTGLLGDVRGVSRQAIEVINGSDCPVVAVDIPSGLCSDTGRVLGSAVRAQHTVSFIGLKQGLLTGDGPDYAGDIEFDDLSVPESVYQQVPASCDRLDVDRLKNLLPTRQVTAHKGQFGHVMIAGGDAGMAGAVAMAAQAACRVGAGLVSCATRPEHVAALVGRCPEVMTHGVISGQEIEPLLARASVVVIGPGLGQGSWGQQLLQKALALSVSLVVDADALNILAAGRFKDMQRDNWILTPHPREAARLLGCSTAQVQQNRFEAVQQLQRRFGGAVILKGAGTLIADSKNRLFGLCPYGNPGMATGGMGDVLSGVLGALLAQGLSPANAARLGVCVHGQAADIAASEGVRGLMATDLIPLLRNVVNEC
jgi:hydroxyethylthiazole kinase-like uncharacterized protein yjeF